MAPRKKKDDALKAKAKRGTKTVKARSLKPGQTIMLGANRDNPSIVKMVERGHQGYDRNRLAVYVGTTLRGLQSASIFHHHVNSTVVVAEEN